MTDTAANFIARSTVSAEDLDHRNKINFNIGRYNAAVPQGKQQFADLNLARERAKNIKWRAIETWTSSWKNLKPRSRREAAGSSGPKIPHRR